MQYSTLYSVNIRASKSDDFGVWKLDKYKGTYSFFNSSIKEKINIVTGVEIGKDDFKLQNISNNVYTYRLPNNIYWGVNTFTGNPYINNSGESELLNPKMAFISLSQEYKLLRYEVSDGINIYHTFRRPKNGGKSPVLGCIINTNILPGNIMMTLYVNHYKKYKDKYYKISIMRNDNGISYNKTDNLTAEEIDKLKDANKHLSNKDSQISFRVTTGNKLMTSIYLCGTNNSYKTLKNMISNEESSSISSHIYDDAYFINGEKSIFEINEILKNNFHSPIKAISFIDCNKQYMDNLINKIKLYYAYNLRIINIKGLKTIRCSCIRSK